MVTVQLNPGETIPSCFCNYAVHGCNVNVIFWFLYGSVTGIAGAMPRRQQSNQLGELGSAARLDLVIDAWS